MAEEEKYKEKKSYSYKKIINYSSNNFIIIPLIKKLFKYILILTLIISSLQEDSNSITLKINRKGNIYIYGCNNYRMSIPNEIIINGIVQSTKSNRYELNITNNEVELIWYNKLDKTSYMFDNCYYIDEINLTNFDASEVTNMDYMFYYCSSLTSLDLSNLNTPKLISINSLFKGCSSLVYINLTNFDTSKVLNMGSLFNGCKNLKELDL